MLNKVLHKPIRAFILSFAILVSVCWLPAKHYTSPVYQYGATDSSTLIHDLAFLASSATAGRETGTPGNKVAQDYIVRRFDSVGLSKTGASWLQPFNFGTNNVQGSNIIGTIKGTRYPDKYIVISAHYDHLGTRNGAIYFGADDNASGTACLMGLAAYFKQHPPQHSIIFVAFDAEEKGLRGSAYFVDHCPVPLSSIMIDLNMDMVSRNDNWEIFASGIHQNPFLKKYIDSIIPHTPIHIRFGHDDPAKGASDDWTNQSDQGNFYKKRIPFLYYGVEDHPDYHKPTDTFDKVNKRFFYQVFLAIKKTAILFDQQMNLE